MSKKASPSLSVESNVTIKVLDKYSNLVRESHLHNKATFTMVQGLLRFLLGDFTPTEENPYMSSLTPEEISRYIPSHFVLGNVGVKMTGRDTEKPLLDKTNPIDYGEMTKPVFSTTSLQDELGATVQDRKTTILEDLPVLKFETADLTDFDDPNNSMGLVFRTFVPAGTLVGVGTGSDRKYFTDLNLKTPGAGWVYYNPRSEEYETLITEMGLVSSTGELLARVLFDGLLTVDDSGEVSYDIDGADNNPVIQTDTTSLVIEWRVGIISIGQNDHVISGASPEVIFSSNAKEDKVI